MCALTSSGCPGHRAPTPVMPGLAAHFSMPYLSEAGLWLDPPSFPPGPPGSWMVDGLCTLHQLFLSERLEAGRIPDSSTEAGLAGTLCIQDLSLHAIGAWTAASRKILPTSCQERTPQPGHLQALASQRSVKRLSPKQFNPTLHQITARHPSRQSNSPSLCSREYQPKRRKTLLQSEAVGHKP